MSLAEIKRSVKVGTLLKLVRHDFLKPILVNGNLGKHTLVPKIHVGLVRPVALVQDKQIALATVEPNGEKTLSYLQWPKASNIRSTANGFEIDLDGTGKFDSVMAYEFVKPSPDFYVKDEGTIFLLTPNTEQAYAWCEEHMPEDAQRFGLSYVVEHRYIRDIIEGILRDSLTVRQQ